jgi:hypothetical protein
MDGRTYEYENRKVLGELGRVGFREGRLER